MKDGGDIGCENWDEENGYCMAAECGCFGCKVPGRQEHVEAAASGCGRKVIPFPTLRDLGASTVSIERATEARMILKQRLRKCLSPLGYVGFEDGWYSMTDAATFKGLSLITQHGLIACLEAGTLTPGDAHQLAVCIRALAAGKNLSPEQDQAWAHIWAQLINSLGRTRELICDQVGEQIHPDCPLAELSTPEEIDVYLCLNAATGDLPGVADIQHFAKLIKEAGIEEPVEFFFLMNAQTATDEPSPEDPT